MLGEIDHRLPFAGLTMNGINLYPTSASTSSFGLSQIELPCFRRQIFAEAVMMFMAHDLEAGLFVNVSCRFENALCPQNHLLVFCLAGEPDTFVNEPSAVRTKLTSEGGSERQSSGFALCASSSAALTYPMRTLDV